MSRVPAPRHAGLAGTTRTACGITPGLGETAAIVVNLLASNPPTNLACMICMATYGNGSRIAYMRAMPAHLRTVAPGHREVIVAAAFCAGAPGSTYQGSCAPRTAMRARPVNGPTSAGFALPGPLIKSWILAPLPLARITRGYRSMRSSVNVIMHRHLVPPR